MGKHGHCERIVYDNEIFRRYPQSTHHTLRSYFISQRGRRLHRVIYEHHFGRIPEGWHVHHKDENPLNNDPSNLGCVPPDIHAIEHALGWSDERREWQRQQADRIRHLTVDWHRSPAGREWHRRHGERVMRERVPREAVCSQCGKRFDDISLRAKFCSGACKASHRRASGVDRVERKCAWCGAVFSTHKSRPTRSCSKRCGALLRFSPRASSPDD